MVHQELVERMELQVHQEQVGQMGQAGLQVRMVVQELAVVTEQMVHQELAGQMELRALMVRQELAGLQV
jgi:hypothetical protein